MKKWLLLIALAGGIYQYQQNPGSFLSFGQDKSQGIVLYATDWCGYCKAARHFFANNGIVYREYNIERSAEGKRQHQQLGGGGVPVINIYGTVIRGYNPAKMRKALGL